MKKIILLITFTFCCLNLFAQQEPTPTPLLDDDAPATIVSRPKGDFKISSDGSGSGSMQFKIDPNNRQVSGGVLNGKATLLPKPSYPAAAKAVRAGGPVSVQVTIDEEGNIISASAVSGHPLLRQAAEQAARGAKFVPTTLSGQLVKVTGVIVYNFVTDKNDWLSFGKNLGIRTESSLRLAIYSLPVDFANEKNSLAKMIEEKSFTEIDDFANLVETRLRFNSSDVWEFQIGLAIGRIVTEITDSNTLRTSLLKIRQLSDFPPTNILAARLEPIKELSNFSNSQKLSENDKAKIIELCNSIR